MRALFVEAFDTVCWKALSTNFGTLKFKADFSDVQTLSMTTFPLKWDLTSDPGRRPCPIVAFDSTSFQK